MYFLSYDVGTTGIKTCLYQWRDGIKMIYGSSYGYGLRTLPNGGAEQDPDEWWDAMVKSTGDLLAHTGIDPKEISGISFCSQMQGLVLVDREGNALRPAMSYMDQRATEQINKGIRTGLKVEGMNALKLLRSLSLTGAVSGSVKDPQWKYLWVKDNEPEVYSKIYKWLDVKEYLIMRMTGRAVMTRDSAFSTMLYCTRDSKEGWSTELCETFGIDEAHLPEIIESTDIVGPLRKKQALELGLEPGTPVFGGGGDASLIGIGTGAAGLGKTHMYAGTSGWVGTVCEKQTVDAASMIAAIVGASKRNYLYFAEMETAGKCLEWVKDHLALDEIGIYLDKKDVCSEGPENREKVYSSLYDYMSEVILSAPPGAGGVIFTPWLHGNRCPFEDPDSKGIFFGITLDTGKTEMLRAVTEGICYHLRWMLECEDKKIETSPVIRFCGGGALSDATCRILADITGRRVEVCDKPQNVGSMGAAVLCAVGLGLIGSVEDADDMIPAVKTFEPDSSSKELYDRNFEVFKNLYKANKKNFAMMR